MSEPVTLDATTGELVPAAAPRDALTMFGDETTGIERARKVANMLRGIVDEKRLAVRLGGGEHLRVEAWCACASMVGVAPMTEWTHEVRHPQSGELEGYEARVQVIQIATGQVIGAAEAGCFFDEMIEKRDGTKYKRWTERHAAKSMAQTRATSKAIGQVLRWIPVLAGFSGTPYEEMPPDGYPEREAAPAQRRAPAKPKAPPPVEEGKRDVNEQAFIFQLGDPPPPKPQYSQWTKDAPTKNEESEYHTETWSHMMLGGYKGKRYNWLRYVIANSPSASQRERALCCIYSIEMRALNDLAKKEREQQEAADAGF